MVKTNLSGLEPKPLHHCRECSEELQDTIENCVAWADTLLASALGNKNSKSSLRRYHASGIALFYPDDADNELDHEGWQVRYESADAGRPIVCCYNMDGIVCWRSADEPNAEKLRKGGKLSRYSLFARVNGNWEYRHSGQLPFGPVVPKSRYYHFED